MTVEKSIRCKSMTSRRGACVIVTVYDDDYDEHVTDVTLLPDEVDEFIRRLRAAKEVAVVMYGMQNDPTFPKRTSPLL